MKNRTPITRRHVIKIRAAQRCRGRNERKSQTKQHQRYVKAFEHFQTQRKYTHTSFEPMWHRAREKPAKQTQYKNEMETRTEYQMQTGKKNRFSVFFFLSDIPEDAWNVTLSFRIHSCSFVRSKIPVTHVMLLFYSVGWFHGFYSVHLSNDWRDSHQKRHTLCTSYHLQTTNSSLYFDFDWCCWRISLENMWNPFWSMQISVLARMQTRATD